jgi:hypothetical protein
MSSPPKGIPISLNEDSAIPSPPHDRPRVSKSPVASLPGPTLVAADSNVFLGGDSGILFTQLILNAMNGGATGILQTQPYSHQSNDRHTPDRLDMFTLPENAKDLIRIFFKYHFVLTPIFHELTIRTAFDAVIECDVTSRDQHRYTLAIMNMLFAIAIAHRRSPTVPKDAKARDFYDRAMYLIQPTMLSHWSIEKVQVLLLGARYLQCSGSPDECWNVLGLAIRIAYGLRLHLVPSDELDYIAKETHKRVWYVCFGLDKLLSMIYGRPAITSTSTFSTPLPEDLDDECIQKTRILYPSPRKPSILSFLIHASKLYRVMESADRLSCLSKLSWESLGTVIFSLDEEFEEWSQNLAPHLKLDGNTKDETEPALILALRANMVRILIHRQSLALTLRFLSESRKSNEYRKAESLKNTMFRHSRNICLQTAMETIHLVGLRHEKTADAAGPSWFNLYYCIPLSRITKSVANCIYSI